MKFVLIGDGFHFKALRRLLWEAGHTVLTMKLRKDSAFYVEKTPKIKEGKSKPFYVKPYTLDFSDSDRVAKIFQDVAGIYISIDFIAHLNYLDGWIKFKNLVSHISPTKVVIGAPMLGIFGSDLEYNESYLRLRRIFDSSSHVNVTYMYQPGYVEYAMSTNYHLRQDDNPNELNKLVSLWDGSNAVPRLFEKDLPKIVIAILLNSHGVNTREIFVYSDIFSNQQLVDQINSIFERDVVELVPDPYDEELRFFIEGELDSYDSLLEGETIVGNTKLKDLSSEDIARAQEIYDGFHE